MYRSHSPLGCPLYMIFSKKLYHTGWDTLRSVVSGQSRFTHSIRNAVLAYPWRWFTPIVLSAFLLISGFLVAINVPLSAYDMVQEFTSRPNDTLPPLPLSNLIPAIFQDPASSFTPQILTVGDTFVVADSVFNYTIVEAFNELDGSKSSFSYFNNPLSSSCDVSSITADITIDSYGGNSSWNAVDLQLSVGITCHIPTPFEINWTGMRGQGSSTWPFPLNNNPARDIFNQFALELAAVFLNWPPGQKQDQLANLRVEVRPCCGSDCDDFPGDSSSSATRHLPTRPPCSALPARLIASQIDIRNSLTPSTNQSGGSTNANGPNTIQWFGPNTTDIFGGLRDDILAYFTDKPLAGLTNLFQNTFQALYHLVRLELGIHLENQIYSSPVMYNRSVSDVYLPLPGFGSDWFYAANDSRVSTSNASLMGEWADAARFFKDSVPLLNYLRPVPRPKPLGSAVTSVFVSTFAMLSGLWTVFSLVAGALAGIYTDGRSDDSKSEPSASSIRKVKDGTGIMEEWHGQDNFLSPQKEKNSQALEYLNLAVENSLAIAQIQLALSRTRLSLKKRGLLEEEDDQGIRLSRHPIAGQEERYSPLVQHRQPDSCMV
ncbi:hypothetical protein DFH08DRAFT_222221 [Mycena albidolilacea]|uniref:Uncharacterized protein n=1 Tax=Mycena albidolilacea TaxID=1033008 RepID=A0AAD6ZX66_9AGAR|nr:hypothetical protein DFH08DRAFT_222221 [Mycena albidolilacea]